MATLLTELEALIKSAKTKLADKVDDSDVLEELDKAQGLIEALSRQDDRPEEIKKAIEWLLIFLTVLDWANR